MEGRAGRGMGPLEGKTMGTSDPGSVSTRLQRIAKLARQSPEMGFTSLNHLFDLELLREAFRRTRKDGAVGVDRQTAAQYAEDLEGNLRSLLERFKSGAYRAPPVRRVHIPKDDGRTRPLGIPTFEDKVLQRAVAMVLEPIYEQDFLNCSFGFRPGRSAHHALRMVRERLMPMQGGWVLDVDIQGYFDALDHAHLREFVGRRVRDGVVRRTIHKWLKAGVLEEGRLSRSSSGTPQGGVISPLLANIYLHEVLDTWFEEEVRPRLGGKAFLVRYADDFVLGFERERDARRVLAVLHKRMAKYGLTLHPDKTRLVKFEHPWKGSGPKDPDQPQGPTSFDLLGFTLYWGKTRKGGWAIKYKTSSKRFSRSLRRVRAWCRDNRHAPLPEQHRRLSAMVRGHCEYFGVPGNSRCLAAFAYEVVRAWQKWLGRRGGKNRMTWERFRQVLERYPLPPPRVRYRMDWTRA